MGNKTITPPFLNSGDCIGITSTARKITLEEIKPAINILESWGLNVKIADSIGLSHNQFAGTDNERRIAFQSLLDDNSVKAILCARGGYGTSRIIDAIDFSTFTKSPKWIIGFSDITVLHSHIHTNYNTQTIHAPMCHGLAEAPKEALSSFQQAIFGKQLNYSFDAHKFNRTGTSEGIIIGGNLSLLHNLIGTASDIDTAEKILFIEDLDEYLYNIDRMMLSLKRSGKLNNLKGLIIGGLTDMNDNEIPFGKKAEAIISEHVSDYSYPVCFNFPAGHIKNNNTLILGANTRIETKATESRLMFI